MTDRFDAEARFDEELRRAARALVTEDLPRGVLDPSVGASLGPARRDGEVRVRRVLPGLASVAGAVAVLLLATAAVFAPGSPGGAGPTLTARPTVTPSPRPTPPLRTTAEIRADLTKYGYACSEGLPLSTIEPGPNAAVRESVVCLAPADAGPLDGAVIVDESASGQVVEVHAKADIVGPDTPAARTAIAELLAKAAALAAHPGDGSTLATWVLAFVPSLEKDKGAVTELRGIGLKLGRLPTGGYQLSVHLPLP